MKIAINTRFLIAGKMEGIGYYTEAVVRNMVQSQPEHEFHFLFDRQYDPEFIYAENVIPHVLYPPARDPILWNIWFDHIMPRKLKKIKPDVLFSPDGFCSLNTDIPQVMTVHDLAYLHYPTFIPSRVLTYYAKYTPKFIEQVDKIIAISKSTKKDILANFPVEKDKIEMIYNGGSKMYKPVEEERKPAIRDKYSMGFPYFYYIGAIHPRKNVESVIRAFDLFKKKSGLPHKLMIIGRFAWNFSVVDEAHKSAEFKKDIHFIGSVHGEELVDIVGSSEGLIFVSHFEGFGLPIIEAMNAEVPVITSGLSSMAEVGDDAVIQVEPNDIEMIADAIQTVATKKKIRESLIKKGKKRAKKFKWQKTAEEVFSLLSTFDKTTSPEKLSVES